MGTKCFPIPKLAFPTLPFSFSLTPVLPSFSLTVPNPCCLLPFPITILLELPLPPLTVNLAFIEPINEALDELEDLVNNLPLNCPWNSPQGAPQDDEEEG